MHLRDTRQRNGRRVLRYLHAMHAITVDKATVIEGMISGPDELFVHYRIQMGRSVRVGSSEYECGPLNLDGVVTSTAVATSFENPMKQPCSGTSGRTLIVSKLRGYDLDSRTTGGVPLGHWKLYFDVSLTDPPDTSIPAAHRIDLMCHFELTAN